jgi:hypothetical protein
MMEPAPHARRRSCGAQVALQPLSHHTHAKTQCFRALLASKTAARGCPWSVRRRTPCTSPFQSMIAGRMQISSTARTERPTTHNPVGYLSPLQAGRLLQPTSSIKQQHCPRAISYEYHLRHGKDFSFKGAWMSLEQRQARVRGAIPNWRITNRR